MKPLDRTFKAISVGMDGKAPDEALNGRVKYRGVDRSEVEVPFGEKDQVSFSFIVRARVLSSSVKVSHLHPVNKPNTILSHRLVILRCVMAIG